MKYILPLLFVLLVGCSKDEKVEPNYTDITGSWTFKSDRIEGEFSVIKSGDKFYVDNSNGFFIVDKGDRISIGEKKEIIIQGFSINQLTLLKIQYGDFIEFRYTGDVSSNYKKMSFTGYSFKHGNDIDNVTLTNPMDMTRK